LTSKSRQAGGSSAELKWEENVLHTHVRTCVRGKNANNRPSRS
jgi:hypothetical protein